MAMPSLPDAQGEGTYGWSNEQSVVTYWCDLVARETERHRQRGRTHFLRSTLYLLVLCLAAIPPLLLLPSLSFTEEGAVALFLSFFSFALLYAGAESLIDVYHRKHRVKMSRLEELRLSSYASTRRDLLRLVMYELALSGRLMALIIGYQSGASFSSILAFAVVTGIIVMAGLNVGLLYDHLTGKQLVNEIMKSMDEKSAEKGRYAYSLMFIALSGFSFITVWQVQASIASVALAFDVLVLFHAARGFLRHHGLRSEYETMQRTTEDFRAWVVKEKPSFDQAHAAYLGLGSGWADEGFEPASAEVRSRRDP